MSVPEDESDGCGGSPMVSGGLRSLFTEEELICPQVPPLVSAFVDALVDHAVSGHFVGPVVPARVVPFRPFEQSYLQLLELNRRPWYRKSPPIDTRVRTPERLVAVGDLHGDFKKTEEVLRAAKLTDEKNNWIGEETTLVQVGDILDRGGDEIQILYFLEQLKREAARAGGAVYVLQGNHELLNVSGNMSYVHQYSEAEFDLWEHWYKMGIVLKKKCIGIVEPFDYFHGIPKNMDGVFRTRLAAFRPGGPLSSRFLAENSAVLVVGENIFVHGADHHKDLERTNKDYRDWILGKKGWAPPESAGPHGKNIRNGLLGSREYSVVNPADVHCELLERTLKTVPGAKRMVVGHMTLRRGINSSCHGKVCRIDVGM